MYQDRILAYMRRHAVCTTTEIRQSLGIPREKWPTFNVEMQRLCKAGHLVRFQKGVYGRPGAEAMDFLQHLYLQSGGYLQGHDGQEIIVSNAVTRSTSKCGVRLRHPKERITEENRSYFAVLDEIRDLEAFTQDPQSAGAAIRSEVNRRQLDWARLVALANRYYQKRVIAQVNGYVEEEYA